MLVHACGTLEYKNRVLLAEAADAAVRAMPSLAPQVSFLNLYFYSIHGFIANSTFLTHFAGF